MSDKKEFSRDDLSKIMQRRINKLNDRIDELETHIEILKIKLEQFDEGAE